MQPRIVQTGTYCSENKGDAAMQLACATVVREQWPQVMINISSPFPDIDGPYYASIANVIPCHRRRLVYSTLQVMRTFAWRQINRMTGRDVGWLIPEKELQAYRQADLVIDLSGDMLTEDYGAHVAISHYIPLLNAILLDCPLFICAQSVGPFRWTRHLARWIFKRARAITLREEISFEYLESIGIDPRSAFLTADMAFLLPKSPDARVDDILAQEGIFVGHTSMVGISVSRILEKKYEITRGVNDKVFIQLMAEVLDDFAKMHDVKIVFIAHVTGPTEVKNDRLISQQIVRKMSSEAHVIRGNYRSDELKGIIGRCTVFIGARMHANIAALSSSIPVLALSYSHKTHGIMEALGQKKWVIPGEQITESHLAFMIKKLWKQRHSVAETLRESSQNLEANARKNIYLVRQLVESKSDTNEVLD